MDLMSHYYGNIIRRLFIVAGIVMLVGNSWLKVLLPVPTFISVLAILLVGIAAGITNPLQKWAMMLNAGIASVLFVVFEYRAIIKYNEVNDPLFLITEGLAIIFFFALYYSTKTVRAIYLKEK
ncbi:MAG: hypothetical protein AAB482_04130 [Patescibacteria group bacterium]